MDEKAWHEECDRMREKWAVATKEEHKSPAVRFWEFLTLKVRLHQNREFHAKIEEAMDGQWNKFRGRR